MASKRKLEVQIVGDEKSLNRAFGQASQDAAKFGKNMSGVHARIGKSFAGIAKQAAGAGVAFAGAYASIAGAKKAIETTETLAKTTLALHKNLGLSVAAASRWAAVAKSRDIDTKALNQSFGTLAKNATAATLGHRKHQSALAALGSTQADVKKRMALLTAGAGPQADAFKKLGISQRELKAGNRDFEGLLSKTADGLLHMKAGAERTALGMKLFGKGWQTVIPVLRGGSKAMNEQLALADKYGVTFKGKTVKSLEDLIAAQRESKFATMGLQVAFGTYLAPAMTKAIKGVSGFVAGIRDGTGAGGKFRDVVEKVVAKVKPIVTFFKDHPKFIAIAVGAWGAYKVASLGAMAAIKVSTFRKMFMRSVPAASAAGLASGAGFSLHFDEASAAGAGGLGKGGKMLRAFKLLGKTVGVAAAAVAAYELANAIDDFFNPNHDTVQKLAKKLGDKVTNQINSSVDQIIADAGGVPAIKAPKGGVPREPKSPKAKKSSLAHVSSVAHSAAARAKAVAPLYPLDAALEALERTRDKLQAGWDRMDALAQRKGLVSDIGSARRQAARDRIAAAKAKAKKRASRSSGGGSSAGGGPTEGGLAVISGGHFLQGMGLQVGESKYFGGVTTNRHKHYPNDHYSGNSIDVNSAGGGAGELSKLQAALSALRGKFASVIQQAFIEDAGSSNQHLHVTFKAMQAKASAAMKAAMSKVTKKDGGSVTAARKGDTSDVRSTISALKDFDRETKRAAKLAMFDVRKVKIEQLKAFSEALDGIRGQVKDLASQAASVFREKQEKAYTDAHEAALKAIGDSPAAKELAALQAEDQKREGEKAAQDLQDNLTTANKAVADATTQAGQEGSAEYKAQWAKALADAKLQQKDAQDAIAAYERTKREDSLQAQLDADTKAADASYDAKIAGLDAEELAFADSMAARLTILTDSLAQQKTAYATWAKDVNAILVGYGLAVDTSPDAEAAVGKGPGAPIIVASQPQKTTARALGGPFSSPPPPGGASNGVTINVNGPVTLRSSREARMLANKLAFQVATAG